MWGGLAEREVMVNLGVNVEVGSYARQIVRVRVRTPQAHMSRRPAGRIQHTQLHKWH